MSLNVIIVAVIGIVVLVVLVMMFTGKAKSFGTATTSCEAKGGTCRAACGSDEIEHYATDCAARAKDGNAGIAASDTRCCSRFYESQPAPPTPTPTPAPPPAAPTTP